jgi:hypothetical protein
MPNKLQTHHQNPYSQPTKTLSKSIIPFCSTLFPSQTLTPNPPLNQRNRQVCASSFRLHRQMVNGVGTKTSRARWMRALSTLAIALHEFNGLVG